MTREIVKSGDATLSVRVDGAAGKPWVILSNGLATDLHMWDDQIDALSQSHRIIRYDTRGHGQSSAPPGPYDFEVLVADMLAVLNHVGADAADVIGLSLGGMTALGLGLAHPDRVRRMVVCDARADNPPAFVAGWDDRIAAIEQAGMEALVAGTMARWFTPGARPEVRTRAEAMIRATSVAGYTGCARALQGLSYLSRLSELRIPVLYIVGELDEAAPPAAMQVMAGATPQGQLVVLPGLAHIPTMESPGAFRDAVLPWLAA
ncbi:alpha/beta fold hydrolase [Roseicitreum antarcticum]|uniref:3-oxoadipate enol-lactonase n=1 Tax=Roseicitreum antarcticum TaxID=564137 RepID=A0A1H3AJT0_9RHOB|nr:alpha/beta fold hydrolase [Roseicitreum antarcticum]SDX29414.1 3-oxoadipate enol-lactonase [Roseicitreum antarcticum]